MYALIVKCNGTGVIIDKPVGEEKEQKTVLIKEFDSTVRCKQKKAGVGSEKRVTVSQT